MRHILLCCLVLAACEEHGVSPPDGNTIPPDEDFPPPPPPPDTPPSGNPGFVTPTASLRAFMETSPGTFTEVGAADLSCLGTLANDPATTVNVSLSSSASFVPVRAGQLGWLQSLLSESPQTCGAPGRVADEASLQSPVHSVKLSRSPSDSLLGPLGQLGSSQSLF